MLIDLTKKAKISLSKRNMLKPPPTRVGLAIDGSYSMRDLYRQGVVQQVVTRCLGAAANFDDNGSMDCWMFDGGSHPLEEATPENYASYVAKHILSQYDIDGGTELRPVIQDIVRFYFPGKQVAAQSGGWLAKMFGRPKPAVEPTINIGELPAFVLVISDGENSDQERAWAALEAAKRHCIYFQMVGIGDEKFNFLRRAADDMPNVGFCEIKDIARISDEDLYDAILPQEFIDWIRANSTAN